METKAKRDFGSFHASNVQELLSLSDKDYVPPAFPFKPHSFNEPEEIGENQIEFGKKAKKNLFYLEGDCCFLNHGAFGGVLKPALETVHKWQEYTEKQPLRFFDRQLLPFLVHVNRRLGAFVGCDPNDLVMVNNATFGTNSVLNSFPWSPSDVILTFNVTYGAVKKLVQHICTKYGTVNKEVTIEFPITGKEQIITQLSNELTNASVKLVIIDHIPSNTPVIMPVAEMIQVCHKANVRVFIDGAHALGALPLNIAALDPDYYVSNAHKWLCCPKGVAFLYVKRELHREVRPAVISHGLDSGFNSEFVWAGLHDYSPMLALHTVLDFWTLIGPDKIRDYMYKTARDGADLLVKSWGSKVAAPMEMFGSMVLVEIPKSIQTMFSATDYSAAETIQNQLFHDFNIEVPIKSVQGHLYVRISAHIHNELSDYEKLAKAINMIAQEKGNKLL